MNRISIHWFRRDLRLEDNTALHKALQSSNPVQCIFIFDSEILQDLDPGDSRVSFIHKSLNKLNRDLSRYGSSIKIYLGSPVKVWKEIVEQFEIQEVFVNADYEPYALNRDQKVESLLQEHDVALHSYKDHVIFEKNQVLKADGTPYTVYTPYKNKWLEQFGKESHKPLTNSRFDNLNASCFEIPALSEIGFELSTIEVPDFDLSVLDEYAEYRDRPDMSGTSRIGPHLRFGTVSARQIINKLGSGHQVFLTELIWREFFIQILFHFPRVVDQNFKRKYDAVPWRNNQEDFKRWSEGRTGIPIVDAGMRELNETGFMHNRVRMIVASFLCKHLLIDWRWGEAYFAQKLLDYELASNNGNWQWAAGTGCDAAPYFRIFNPITQAKKFDPQSKYINRWLPDLKEGTYPSAMVDLKQARNRALEAYKKAV